MTGIKNLTQSDEVIKRLMTDLQANNIDALALLNHFKKPATYDLDAVFTTLSADSDIMQAFNHLREQHPASDYARRSWQRFSVNADALANNTTTYGLGGITAVNDAFCSNGSIVAFKDLGEYETQAAVCSSLDVTGKRLTVSQGGLYQLSASFCLGFFPSDSYTVDFSDRVVELAGSGLLKTPVQFTLVIIPAGQTAPRSWHPLVTSTLSQQDMIAGRKRVMGGSLSLKLVAGDTVELIFNRGSQLGRYRKTVAGSSTYTSEHIGYSKYVSNLIGSNPVRDIHNWVEILRLA